MAQQVHKTGSCPQGDKRGGGLPAFSFHLLSSVQTSQRELRRPAARTTKERTARAPCAGKASGRIRCPAAAPIWWQSSAYTRLFVMRAHIRTAHITPPGLNERRARSSFGRDGRLLACLAVRPRQSCLFAEAQTQRERARRRKYRAHAGPPPPAARVQFSPTPRSGRSIGSSPETAADAAARRLLQATERTGSNHPRRTGRWGKGSLERHRQRGSVFFLTRQSTRSQRRQTGRQKQTRKSRGYKRAHSAKSQRGVSLRKASRVAPCL